MNIELGDLIQVELNGCLCLEKPSKVTEIIYSNKEYWVFVEASSSGIPLDNAILIKKWNQEN